MLSFDHDGICVRYQDEGEGVPFVFQHGLGGDLSQPFGIYRPAAGVRLIGFDFRGHGETRPLGDVAKLTIAILADDLIALLDHLAIERAVIGGISLGSAVAVNTALRYPKRVRGLVLSRPAWIDRPLPANVHLYSMMADLLQSVGAKEGLERFRRMAEFQAMESESPDCAKSLVGQFEQPRAEECAARLARLIVDTPCPDRAMYGTINVPALVLGNRQDPIHPWELAETLTGLIPGAELCEITPKSVSLERHAADVQKAVAGFLVRQVIGENSQGVALG
jgi:pimeloyl-ACP methyl ester carboxylesterase